MVPRIGFTTNLRIQSFPISNAVRELLRCGLRLRLRLLQFVCDVQPLAKSMTATFILCLPHFGLEVVEPHCARLAALRIQRKGSVASDFCAGEFLACRLLPHGCHTVTCGC